MEEKNEVAIEVLPALTHRFMHELGQPAWKLMLTNIAIWDDEGNRDGWKTFVGEDDATYADIAAELERHPGAWPYVFALVPRQLNM